MKFKIIKSYAKINLSLGVTGRLNSRYHKIESLVSFIKLHDEIKIKKHADKKHKIQEAIEMLNKAYNQKKNDPFIIDSVGWGYYLIGDFVNAENFLRKAIQLMPKDPIVNDHYGDVLWKLNRKIQAKYYWQSALSSEESENKMKKNISKKLLKGLNES